MLAVALNSKLFIAAIFIGMAICIAIILLTPSKKKTESSDEADAASSPDTDSDESAGNELTAVPAVVVSKRIDSDYNGDSKYAKYNIANLVTFLVDGEEREVVVDHATFERVYDGEASTLVMEGDEFIDFSDGEDAEGAEVLPFDDEKIDPEYTLDVSEEE
ncbi:MAG: hypothetical protein J6L71_02170 [Clostridia bacterium]|nr:hypothetical protein [Clostridia bacterium]